MNWSAPRKDATSFWTANDIKDSITKFGYIYPEFQKPDFTVEMLGEYVSNEVQRLYSGSTFFSAFNSVHRS
jgi:hypothetical protein